MKIVETSAVTTRPRRPPSIPARYIRPEGIIQRPSVISMGSSNKMPSRPLLPSTYNHVPSHLVSPPPSPSYGGSNEGSSPNGQSGSQSGSSYGMEPSSGSYGEWKESSPISPSPLPSYNKQPIQQEIRVAQGEKINKRINQQVNI